MAPNTLESQSLIRQMEQLKERVRVLENYLNGRQIPNARIGNLILGGADNVHGTLSLRDASNVEKIAMNKDGIDITDGKITIRNDAAQSVLDGKGIVSNSNNFTLTNFNGTPSQNITSTSATDITGSSQSFVLARTTNILFLLATEVYLVESAGNTGDGEIGLNIDGAYPFCVTRMRSGETHLETRCNFYVATRGAGTIPVKVQAKLENIYAGSPTLHVRSFSWTYILLGT